MPANESVCGIYGTAFGPGRARRHLQNGGQGENPKEDLTTSPQTEPGGYELADPTQRLILSIFTSIVSVIGIPGNLLVIVAVVFCRKLQTKTNAFVVNLAMSDLSSCLVLPFMSLALLRDVWPLSDVVCVIVGAVILIGPLSSVVNLALIAFNRYYMITRPRSSYDRLFSRSKLIIMLFVAWIIPTMVTVVPPMLGIGGIGFNKRYKVCITISKKHSDLYAILMSILVQVPCLVIIVVCYIKIYKYIDLKNRELFKNSSQLEMSKKQPNSIHAVAFKRQVQVTKNLFMVVCSYIICIMPFSIASLIPPSYPVMPWVAVILIMNTCINPIIYGLKHAQFRQVFRFIITCKWRLIPEPSKILQPLITNTSSSE
ncbi:5-hydroxytryptamine receptor 4 [Holothuria leucospilota]|uniref:5-hydroxytryptamine receptor 4 n=1 Tax=Holothuria leucospilota TaxID=206669 RepID=A0A9Q0YMF9_HOLLE|nr:5-hydroxytryptamine receptor 4 [Holothuria leucospilota]